MKSPPSQSADSIQRPFLRDDRSRYDAAVEDETALHRAMLMVAA